MALAISHALLCPKLQFAQRNFRPKAPAFNFSPPSFREIPQNRRIVMTAASAAGSSNSGCDLNPYEVLGVNPIEGLDMVKAAYKRKHNEALNNGDEETADRLEKAYDKLMMSQLTNRKKGLTFGSFQIHPVLTGNGLNAAPNQAELTKIIIVAWIAAVRNADYKPLQFLTFAFIYRLFEKLKSFEKPVNPTYTGEGEEVGKGMQMGKRLLRSLSLVFGCIAVASLAYTGSLNVIEYMASYVPAILYYNQELIITSVTAVMLYIMASYYR